MKRLCFCLLSGVAALQAHAQQVPVQNPVVPDAGRSMRELEQRPPSLPQKQSLDLDLPDAPLQQEAQSSQRVWVDGFVLEGNSAIPSTELLPLLDDLVHRQVSLGQLQAGAHRLTQHYRARGYPLARAYLPAQAIDQAGRIAVLEGRYGQVQAPQHLAPAPSRSGSTPAHAEAGRSGACCTAGTGPFVLARLGRRAGQGHATARRQCRRNRPGR